MSRKRVYPTHPAMNTNPNTNPVPTNPVPTNPVPTNPSLHAGGVHATVPVSPVVPTMPAGDSVGPVMPQPSVGGVAPGTVYSGPGVTSPANVSAKKRDVIECSPEFIQATVSKVPSTPGLLKKSSVPFGLVVHPLSTTNGVDQTIPLLDFGSLGIIRCKICRVYINPYVTFHDAGQRWKCNMCNSYNQVPSSYYCPVDKNGIRTDIADRTELNHCAVEFIAPTEYMVRPPQPPTYFFLLDVSYHAVVSEQLTITISTLLSIVENLPSNSKIGLMTYDSQFHFYNLNPKLSSPHMIVNSTLEDIDMDGYELLVNLNDSKDIIVKLLNSIPEMFANTQNVHSCLGPAMEAAYNIQKRIGGKLLVFSNTLPSAGKGTIPQRFEEKLLGTVNEVKLLKPESQFYKDFAVQCTDVHISVDFFFFSSHFNDIASIGVVASVTGGQVFHYPRFSAHQDGEKFSRDLQMSLYRETGYEAVMRVRCSGGIELQQHFGNFYMRRSDLMSLPMIDSHKAFAIQLEIKENLQDIGFAATFQTALLYTSSNGQRRIRVFTYQLPIAFGLNDIYQSVNVPALMNLMGKMAINKALNTKLASAREALKNKTVDILTNYVKASGSRAADLNLPENLQVLPLYTLAMVKSVIFKKSTDIHPDVRSYYIHLFRTLPVDLSTVFIYPRLFSLHDMQPEYGLQNEDGALIFPPIRNLSMEQLDRAGAFLMDDGLSLFLWIGPDVSSSFSTEVFGYETVNGIDSAQLSINVNEMDPSSLSSRIWNIIQTLRATKPLHQKLIIIKERDIMETSFFSHLIEDRMDDVASYFEFYSQIKAAISASK
eukprot:TRINITY_DN9650_c0_g1_i1.p1 TRINITY_DN9650_c0_g1~~TRINITY_DN9650_c0_g1_i1.p1  ORF type:complete len:822 (-),score=181.15 TRINITY_DN9650_c0_g1_i1:53-2518(-)